MFEQWIVAALHVLTLGIGMSAIVARSIALRNVARGDRGALGQALMADNFWGVAALLWLSTGLVRVFSGVEKGSAYYAANSFFWVKMALFALIIVLELRPMITLIRWRIQGARKQTPDLAPAGAFATSGAIQTVLLVVMVLLATGMARGLGM